SRAARPSFSSPFRSGSALRESRSPSVGSRRRRGWLSRTGVQIFGSRAHLAHLSQTILEQPPFVVLGDGVAEELLGALGGELAGVFGELVARVLEPVVDFVARGLEDLRRFRFRG